MSAIPPSSPSPLNEGTIPTLQTASPQGEATQKVAQVILGQTPETQPPPLYGGSSHQMSKHFDLAAKLKHLYRDHVDDQITDPANSNI